MIRQSVIASDIDPAPAADGHRPSPSAALAGLPRHSRCQLSGGIIRISSGGTVSTTRQVFRSRGSFTDLTLVVEGTKVGHSLDMVQPCDIR